jgi:hypothetical protein
MRRNSKSTEAARAPSAIRKHIGTPIASSPIRLHTPFALRVFGAALILVLLSSATQPREHAVHGGLLLVANKGDHTLDPSAGHQVAAVQEVGITGHEVAVSPDGRLAYVPIYGDSGVGKPGTDGRRSGTTA